MSDLNPSKRSEAGGIPSHEGGTGTTCSGMESLLGQLRTSKDTDDSRVARARELLKQDGYPHESILLKVARHLANEWPEESRPQLNSRQG